MSPFDLLILLGLAVATWAALRHSARLRDREEPKRQQMYVNSRSIGLIERDGGDEKMARPNQLEEEEARRIMAEAIRLQLVAQEQQDARMRRRKHTAFAFGGVAIVSAPVLGLADGFEPVFRLMIVFTILCIWGTWGWAYNFRTEEDAWSDKLWSLRFVLTALGIVSIGNYVIYWVAQKGIAP